MEYITYQIMNSGIEEKISFSRTTVEDIFVPLLQKLAKLREEKGRRILVMLAAPPGAGKTTLVHFLAKMVEERENLPALTILGMDGFHRYQDYLLSHTMERNGWRELRQYADYIIRITAEEEMLRRRLLCRKMSTGVDEEEAAAFVDYSDMYNVRTCLRESSQADLILEVMGDGRLCMKEG